MAFSNFRLLYRTPILTIAVYNAFARYTDILRTICTEGRLTATRIKTLKRCLYQRVKIFIGCKEHYCPLLQMKVYI